MCSSSKRHAFLLLLLLPPFPHSLPYAPSKMSKQLLVYASAEAIQKAIPLGRWGSEEDIGGTVVYLSSRAGAWVTGTVLPVDGGSTAKPLGMVHGDD